MRVTWATKTSSTTASFWKNACRKLKIRGLIFRASRIRMRRDTCNHNSLRERGHSNNPRSRRLVSKCMMSLRCNQGKKQFMMSSSRNLSRIFCVRRASRVLREVKRQVCKKATSSHSKKKTRICSACQNNRRCLISKSAVILIIITPLKIWINLMIAWTSTSPKFITVMEMVLLPGKWTKIISRVPAQAKMVCVWRRDVDRNISLMTQLNHELSLTGQI